MSVPAEIRWDMTRDAIALARAKAEGNETVVAVLLKPYLGDPDRLLLLCQAQAVLMAGLMQSEAERLRVPVSTFAANLSLAVSSQPPDSW